ncbi:pyrroloquinoline quinone precursor peptide PqqA [Sedimenticola sp.]
MVCKSNHEENVMKWETPDFCELRMGFEVTAYVYTR